MNTRIPSLSFLVAKSPSTSIKQNQTLTTHNANRHFRVRFYTFGGQPLSKQLYNNTNTEMLYISMDKTYQAHKILARLVLFRKLNNMPLF